MLALHMRVVVDVKLNIQGMSKVGVARTGVAKSVIMAQS